MKVRVRPTRRFPVVTRDTARPEGGRRAMGAEHAAPYRQWPLLAVCCGVLIGLLVTIGDFRAGTLIIGLSLLAAAVMRRTMPSVGMLAVRSSFTDMLTYATLGIAIAMLGLMVQPAVFPVLDEIVHFVLRRDGTAGS
jgi:hypothetical protein